MEIQQKISMLNCKKENHGAEEYSSETSIRENCIRSSGQEPKGIIGVEGGTGTCFQ